MGVLALVKSRKNKIQTLIQRANVENASSVIPGEYPLVQINNLGRISDMENISPYGLASSLPITGICAKFNIQGESSNQVGTGYDPSTLPALKINEIAAGAFSAKIPTYFKFTEEGKIEIWKGGAIIVTDLIDYILTHP